MNYLKLSGIQKKSTINTLAGHPLDSRQCVDEYEDLFKKSTWEVGNKTYIYNGMPVTVKNTGKMYILKGFISSDIYNITPQYDGWTGEDDNWLRDVNWQELLIDEQRLSSAETVEEDGVKYLVLKQKTKLGIDVDPIKIPLDEISNIKTLGLFAEGNDYTDVGGTFNGKETKGISIKGTDSIEVTSDIEDTINIALSWKPLCGTPANVIRSCSFGYIKPIKTGETGEVSQNQMEKNILNIYADLGSKIDNGKTELLRYTYTNSRSIDIPIQLSNINYSKGLSVPFNTSQIIMPNISQSKLKSISIVCSANNSIDSYVVEIWDYSNITNPVLLNRGYSDFSNINNPKGHIITNTPGKIYTWYFKENENGPSIYKYGRPNLNLGSNGYMIKFSKMNNTTFSNANIDLYCNPNATSLDNIKILYNNQYKYVLPAIEIYLDNIDDNYNTFKYFEEIIDMHNYGTELPNPDLIGSSLADTYTVRIDVKKPNEEYITGQPFQVNKSMISSDEYTLKTYPGYSYKIYINRDYVSS